MRARAIIGLVICSLYDGCVYQPFNVNDYHFRHPEFPQQSALRSASEYQISIVRSWKTSLFLIAGQRSPTEAYVGYAFMKPRQSSIKPLSFIRISPDDWTQIEIAFREVAFYTEEEPCFERAYSENKLYVVDHILGCEEIVMTDGSLMDFLAVSSKKVKGVRYPLIDKEDELIQFTDHILEIAGIDYSFNKLD